MISPTCSGICQVLQTGIERTMIIGHTVIESGGHGQLITDGNFLLLQQGTIGPSRAHIIRRSILNG